MKYFLLVLVFITKVLSLNPLLVHSAGTSQTKSESLLEFFQNNESLKENYLILKKDEINLNSLNSLNVKSLNSIKIQNENIVVPNNFKPIFLFNEIFNYSKFNFNNLNEFNFTEFLNNFPPFNIPKLNYYDLNLLIPKSNTELNLNEFTKENIPLLVFYLNNNEEIIETSTVSNKIIEFDALTKNWIKNLSINQLIEGFFCNLSDEICIKMDLNNSKLLIFSIWEDQNLLLPLSILLNNEINENLIPKTKSYQQLMHNFKHLRTINKRNELNSIDDLKFKLEQRLKQKKLKNDRKISIKSNLKNLESNPNNLNSNINTIINKKKPSNEFNSFKAEKEEIENFKKQRTKNAIDKIKLVSTRADKADKDLKASELEEIFKNQRNKNAIDKIKLVSTRLDKSIKDLKTNELEESKNSCEQITWFNVFHHSIFKNVNFCV